jgi:hypothetical protein
VLLRFLGDAIADAPVLVVGSYREREARQHEHPESFDELARGATRLTLRGLSVEGVGASISTGRFCCYAPPSETPPAWDL